jgi:hypothetical protein
LELPVFFAGFFSRTPIVQRELDRGSTMNAVQAFRDHLDEEEWAFNEHVVKDRFYGKPAPVDFEGHPKAWNYRTMIRNAVLLGPNAAGKYTIIQVWQTGSGFHTWIIETATGKILVDDLFPEIPFAAWKYKIDSQLIIENPVGYTIQCFSRYLLLKDGKISELKHYPWKQELCDALPL